MIARIFTALIGLFAVALPSAAQLVEIAVEPYVVHDGSIAELDGMTTYHVYAVCENATDEISAVYGDATAPLSLTSTTGFYQNPLGSNVGWTVNPAFFSAFPAIEYDSWITLGAMNQNEVTGQPNTVGMDTAFATFSTGGDLVVNSQNGGSWFTLFGDTQAQAGDDLKVLIAQLTVTNDAIITGNFNIQIFLNGQPSTSQQFEGIPFSSVAGAVFGCMDPEATNYNPDATESGEICIYPCALELFVSEVIQNTCPGVGDGEVMVTSMGGQMGVLFGIDGDAPSLAVGIFDDLTGGTYTVSAVDGAGCEASIEVEVVAPDPIVISASLTVPVSCSGNSDAVISGSASGGTGMLSYSLSANFAESSSELNFGDLGPGLYTVYAMDENGCTASSGAVSIANPQTLSVAVSGGQNGILDATCPDSEDGSVVLIAIGGTGTPASMTFSIDGENFAPGNVLNLNPGTYTFYAMDENGCIGATTNEYTVNGPPPVEWSIEEYDASCHGEDGVVYIFAEGGNGGLTYELEGNSYSGAFEIFIAAGDYEVVATDAEGCVASAPFTINQPSPLEWNVTVLDEPSCSNGFNGTVELEAFGGVSPYLVQYNGMDQDFESFAIWTDGTGPTDFVLTDANGCQTEGSYEMDGAPSFEGFTPIVTGPTCFGSSDAAVEIDPEFNYTEWNVAWTGPSSGSQSPFNVIGGLVAGSYSLSLSSDEFTECEATIDVVIDDPQEVELALNSASPLCSDEQTGIIQASAENATGTVEWTLNGVAVSNQTTLALFGLPAGTYEVIATDELGCSGLASAILTNPEPLNQLPSTVVQPSSFANGSIALDAPSNFSVSWYSTAGLFIGIGPSLENLESGGYTASIENPDGCLGSQNFQLDFAGCELLSAEDWPDGSSGLFPQGSVTWLLGVEMADEWVLRVPDVVADEGVDFAVSHFEVETIMNLPDGVTMTQDDEVVGAEESYCLPLTGVPTAAGSYDVTVSGTMYIMIFGTQFPIPNYSFIKTVVVEASEDPIEGCTYEWASNYNSFATHDDGSCELVGGCTYEEAVNFNAGVQIDDGSCVFEFQSVDEDCYFDFDENGWVGMTDLLMFLLVYSSECP